MNLDLNNILYHALFVVDVNKLKEMFPPKHINLFYHHTTIEFKPSNYENFDLGNKSKLKIIGRLTTDIVDVLLVDNPKSKNNIPHITLSTAEGIKPFQSNSELEKNKHKINYFDNIYIDVIEGLFNNENKKVFNL